MSNSDSDSPSLSVSPIPSSSESSSKIAAHLHYCLSISTNYDLAPSPPFSPFHLRIHNSDQKNACDLSGLSTEILNLIQNEIQNRKKNDLNSTHVDSQTFNDISLYRRLVRLYPNPKPISPSSPSPPPYCLPPSFSLSLYAHDDDDDEGSEFEVESSSEFNPFDVLVKEITHFPQKYKTKPLISPSIPTTLLWTESDESHHSDDHWILQCTDDEGITNTINQTGNIYMTSDVQNDELKDFSSIMLSPLEIIFLTIPLHLALKVPIDPKIQNHLNLHSQLQRIQMYQTISLSHIPNWSSPLPLEDNVSSGHYRIANDDPFKNTVLQWNHHHSHSHGDVRGHPNDLFSCERNARRHVMAMKMSQRNREWNRHVGDVTHWAIQSHSSINIEDISPHFPPHYPNDLLNIVLSYCNPSFLGDYYLFHVIKSQNKISKSLPQFESSVMNESCEELMDLNMNLNKKIEEGKEQEKKNPLNLLSSVLKCGFVNASHLSSCIYYCIPLLPHIISSLPSSMTIIDRSQRVFLLPQHFTKGMTEERSRNETWSLTEDRETILFKILKLTPNADGEVDIKNYSQNKNHDPLHDSIGYAPSVLFLFVLCKSPSSTFIDSTLQPFICARDEKVFIVKETRYEVGNSICRIHLYHSSIYHQIQRDHWREWRLKGQGRFYSPQNHNEYKMEIINPDSPHSSTSLISLDPFASSRLTIPSDSWPHCIFSSTTDQSARSSDCLEHWSTDASQNLQRGAVCCAIYGKMGQLFPLRENGKRLNEKQKDLFGNIPWDTMCSTMRRLRSEDSDLSDDQWVLVGVYVLTFNGKYAFIGFPREFHEECWKDMSEWYLALSHHPAEIQTASHANRNVNAVYLDRDIHIDPDDGGPLYSSQQNKVMKQWAMEQFALKDEETQTSFACSTSYSSSSSASSSSSESKMESTVLSLPLTDHKHFLWQTCIQLQLIPVYTRIAFCCPILEEVQEGQEFI